MDGNGFYPLVPVARPTEQGALVPVSLPLVVDADYYDDAETDALALLWQRFCQLFWLFLLALVVIRRLQLQLVGLRQQSRYWQAQHRRAAPREAQQSAELQRLHGELPGHQQLALRRLTRTSSPRH